MGLFNRKGKRQGTMICQYKTGDTEISAAAYPKETTTPAEPPVETTEPQEEWIWVEGYKGTDKDMKARHNDIHYELGVEYSVGMPDEVRTCEYGFHFCLKLSDVYNYYDLNNGNRFFKVRALARKKDIADVGKYSPYSLGRIDKIAARTIILTEEITDSKLLVDTFYANHPCLEVLPAECNESIIKKGYGMTYNEYYRTNLIEKGYSETFANIIIQNKTDYVKRALAIADQEGVSMDMKVWFIFAGGSSSGR